LGSGLSIENLDHCVIFGC